MTPLQTARRYAESGHGAHPGMAACPECGLKTQDGHREGCDVAAMVRALEDAEWRPINEAPRDGTVILIAGCSFGPRVRMASWGCGRYLGRKQGYRLAWVDNPGSECNPTMFRPLPPALLLDEVK